MLVFWVKKGFWLQSLWVSSGSNMRQKNVLVNFFFSIDYLQSWYFHTISLFFNFLTLASVNFHCWPAIVTENERWPLIHWFRSNLRHWCSEDSFEVLHASLAQIFFLFFSPIVPCHLMIFQWDQKFCVSSILFTTQKLWFCQFQQKICYSHINLFGLGNFFFKLNSVVIYTALQIGNCKCHLIFASYLFLVWLRAHRFPICTKDFEIDTHH